MLLKNEMKAPMPFKTNYLRMNKSILSKIFLVLCLSFSTFKAYSQQVNTMYFMENVPVRNYLNPAFQPLSNFYLGFPILGFTQFGVGNNSLTLKDFAYNDANGKPIWFLNKNGNKGNFYNALKPTTLIQANFQFNILDFGFRTGKAYWSFSLTEKAEGQIGIPNEMMKLLLYGTPEMNNNLYDFSSFGADMTLYTEAGLGYSRKVNDRWSVGGKLKLLLGTANVSGSSSNLKLNAGIDEWNLVGNGTVNYSSPINLNGNSFQNFDPITDISANQWLKPSGMGGGIDLGATYKLTKNVTLSAAVTDLGFIRWNKNLKKMGYTVDYKFTGVDNVTLDNIDNSKRSDSIFTAFKNSVHDTITNNSAYTTYTSPKINVGVEYAFLNNKMSLGLLSRTLIHNKVAYEELTGSLNLRPLSWFDLSGSYSILNGRASNIGAGLGLRTGFIHWFVSADYVPVKFATINLNNNSNSKPQKIPVPYNTQGVNFAFGVNFVFGNRKDADKDGVIDSRDKCPNTPFGVLVDKKGCPLDTDGDGVPDYLDKCPNTPPEAYSSIDEHGCPIDSDGDGIPDYLDKCPNTPTGAKVDSIGCPLDSDGDGVPDYLDKCPNTPVGAKVDSIGCPLDTDGDGVPDYLDKCPDTPKEAKGMVDKNGCLLDSDGDGVPDYLDLCPNTPPEAKGFVDKNGCMLDTDGDGVPDYLDKCPDTPIEARGKVDENGCPRDTDGDGIPDYLDKCPTIAGVAENSGCPGIKKEVRTLFKKALQGIQFETGKDKIKPKSYPILNQIATVLSANPTYLIEICGHTDNVGNSKSNQLLSQNRAESVRKYLINKGIDQKRMKATGYGDMRPVSTNDTPVGRSLNRRVEFEVSFEEVSLQ